MERSQLNLRISEMLAKLIDAKRIELAQASHTIPSRSDVLRLALAKFLEVDLTVIEQDRRRGTQKDEE